MKGRDGVVRWHWRGAARAAAAIAVAGTTALLTACSATAAGAERKIVAATLSPRASVSGQRAAAPGPKLRAKPEHRPPAALPVAPADSGRLPQTQAFPKTTDAAFRNLVHDLWLAVTTGKPRYALPAFFPLTAYEQVKAISDPAYDWQSRLWDEFALDVGAVHPLVAHGVKLVKVIVPAEYAQWIPPGACYNSIGYWHVPGSRVVYERGGQTLSFGVASLISWRGDWYVVHFGGVVRGAYGMVDDPQSGPGVPGPPGGC